MEGCPFCDVGEIRSTIEWMYGADSTQHMVFEPLDPVVTGHLLVVPVVHVQDATEDPLVTAMSAGVSARVAQRYRSANILTSVGTPATQTVQHLHWHVVPRRTGDGLRLPWTADSGEEVEGMALRKHGEGDVIPDNDEQKTAAQNDQGMSKEAREELDRENAEADGADR
jgi:histidine triad (HIT) family protein